MKLSCHQKVLSHALADVGRAIANQTTLPILTHVKLTAKADTLTLHGADLSMFITRECTAATTTPGSTTIPYRLFRDLINSFPDAEVTLELVDQKPRQNETAPKADATTETDPPALGQSVKVVCARSVSYINCGNAEDYPLQPALTPDCTVTVNAAALRVGIALTQFATASSSEERKQLSGVLIEVDPERITMVGADGYRLSKYTIDVDSPAQEELKAIVPARAMREIRNMIADDDGPIRLELNKDRKQIRFSTDNLQVVSQLVSGDFPNYAPLLPTQWTTSATLANRDFLLKVKTTAMFSPDNKAILCFLEKKSSQLRMKAQSGEIGNSQTAVNIEDWEGKDTHIAFNHTFLSELTNQVGDQQVTMQLTTPDKPARFGIAGVEEFVHIIMPIHVDWPINEDKTGC